MKWEMHRNSLRMSFKEAGKKNPFAGFNLIICHEWVSEVCGGEKFSNFTDDVFFGADCECCFDSSFKCVV